MHDTTTSPRLDALKVACSACNLRELCLPVGLSDEELSSIDDIIGTRRTVRRGESLFHAGEAFTALYAVRTGFFKTVVSAADGVDAATASLWREATEANLPRAIAVTKLDAGRTDFVSALADCQAAFGEGVQASHYPYVDDEGRILQNLSLVSTNAIAAADIVIAPIRMDLFSIKGLSRLMGEINTLESEYRLKPELIILPTHYAPQFSRISRMQQTLTAFRDLMAPCVISASEQFPKSLDQYLPLTLQVPTSQASKEYKVFAEFVPKRLSTMRFL